MTESKVGWQVGEERGGPLDRVFKAKPSEEVAYELNVKE